MAASKAPVAPTARLSSSERPRSFRTIALSLSLALGIVLAAWAVGGRQGFDSIGSGGANQQLLPKIGEPAPAFSALSFKPSAEGVSLAVVESTAFAGKPLWINFWASWCAPCRAELPEMKAAFAELEPRGLEVLAISLDEPTEEAVLYAAQNQLPFRVLSDPDRAGTSSAYSVNNFPTHIFVDADGIVRSIVLAQMSAEEAIAHGEKAINPTA